MKRFRGKLWWIALAGVLLVEAFVFAWTRPDTKRWTGVPLLALDLGPAEGGGHRLVEQPERVAAVESQLSFAAGRCGVFLPLAEGETGRGLDFYYFEYEAGNPRFIYDVFGHAPEVCMRAIGASLHANHGQREVVVGGQPIAVRVLEFRSPVSAGPLWVMQMQWLPPEAPFQAGGSASSMRREKILSGLFGNPNPPARVLLAGASGYPTLEEAWADYERLLVSRLRVEAPGERDEERGG
jgi:hypothetical protein